MRLTSKELYCFCESERKNEGRAEVSGPSWYGTCIDGVLGNEWQNRSAMLPSERSAHSLCGPAL